MESNNAHSQQLLADQSNFSFDFQNIDHFFDNIDTSFAFDLDVNNSSTNLQQSEVKPIKNEPVFFNQSQQQKATRLKAKPRPKAPIPDKAGLDLQNPQKNATEQKIKRPLNAFMVWSQMERRKLNQQMPDVHNVSISRQLGLRWKLFDEKQKQPYKAEAARLREIHANQYPEYKYKPVKRKAKQPTTNTSSASSQDYQPQPSPLFSDQLNSAETTDDLDISLDFDSSDFDILMDTIETSSSSSSHQPAPTQITATTTNLPENSLVLENSFLSVTPPAFQSIVQSSGIKLPMSAPTNMQQMLDNSSLVMTPADSPLFYPTQFEEQPVPTVVYNVSIF